MVDRADINAVDDAAWEQAVAREAVIRRLASKAAPNRAEFLKAWKNNTYHQDDTGKAKKKKVLRGLLRALLVADRHVFFSLIIINNSSFRNLMFLLFFMS